MSQKVMKKGTSKKRHSFSPPGLLLVRSAFLSSGPGGCTQEDLCVLPLLLIVFGIVALVVAVFTPLVSGLVERPRHALRESARASSSECPLGVPLARRARRRFSMLEVKGSIGSSWRIWLSTSRRCVSAPLSEAEHSPGQNMSTVPVSFSEWAILASS